MTTSRPAASARMRALGTAGWQFTGLVAACAIVLFLLFVLRSLLMPLLVAAALAVVFLPLVDRIASRRIPRSIVAVLCCLAFIGVVVLCAVILAVSLYGQAGEIGTVLDRAVDHLREVAAGLGLSQEQVTSVKQDVVKAAPAVVTGLVSGLADGAAAVMQVVLGVVLGLYIMFFLLKDAEIMESAVVRTLPLPSALGHEAAGRAAVLVRRYLLGVTLIALVNTVLVAAGALILRLPVIGAIALATFMGAYIPYLGAFISGAFAVLIALGSGGPGTALWMLLVVILANGSLQNMIAPFVFGSALEIHPLIVLLVTVAAGIVAGLAGVILAVPVTAMAIDLVRLLRRDREAAAGPGAEREAAPEPGAGDGVGTAAPQT
ncbi:AI-2E family transporter [Planobispora siamensis]|uniref:AI-2E family transporter n=1 Tax=Planobispora siamensis TaxID=936338 RepID=A0A8J3SNA4_9ACTN|nr:AI-2E family transporter [Planobispora siamensis]GIH95721.1 AI-2E family transporter [Planobispora siamensis]